MSAIHSKDTQPEILLRKALFARGLRYRLHCKLPGSPDVVFPSRLLVVLIHGCFWHRCQWHGRIPSSNRTYWKKKLERNAQRDKENIIKLRKLGWRVITVWEHQIMEQGKLEKAVERVVLAVAV